MTSKLLAILVAVVIGVLAAEIFVVLTKTGETESVRNSFISEWQRAGVNYDPRSKLEVVLALRENGQSALPKLNPATLLESTESGSLRSRLTESGAELLPLGSVSQTLSVYCNELGSYLIYDTDRHGFRNPTGTWSRAELNFAVLGDSYAEGACVPTGAGFVDLMRLEFPAILNLGMGGNGPLLQLAGLLEFLVEKRPDVVLWIYDESNDLFDLVKERRSALLMRYLEPGFSQELKRRQSTVDTALRLFFENEMAKAVSGEQKPPVGIADILKLRHLRGRLQRLKHQLGPPSLDADSALALFRQVLTVARDSAAEWGGEMVFVYLPRTWTYSGETTPAIQTRLRPQVLGLAKSLRLPVIDLTTDLVERVDPKSLNVFPELGHFSEYGNRLVAEVLLKEIRKARLIPPFQ